MPIQTRSFSDLITFTRASNATYFDSTGMLKRAASNVSRIDYNPSTLAVRGLLVEESRTNLITYSEYFDNAVWTKSNTTVGVNTHTSPSGAVSADTIIENAGAGNKVILISISGNTNTGYTFSFFVKAAGRTQVIASFRNQAQTIGIQALFDLSAVTATTSGSYGSPNTQYTPTIASIGNGWYRCSLGGILSASSSIENLQAQIYIASGGSTSYTGNGTSGLYLWGAQLEAGAFATSYIPSSVTFSGRTSSGTYFDSAGVLQTAGSGVSRTTYNPSNLSADPFLLLEESRTNSIRNNTMAGAVADTPGTLPTNWDAVTPSNGLSRRIVAIGTEKGIPYVDINYFGTTTSASLTAIYWESATQIAASSGQTWTNSVYVSLVSGSTTNITDIVCGIDENNNLGTYLTGSVTTFTPSSGSLNGKRYSHTRTLTNASTVYARPFVFFSYNNGVAINITLRIGMPQMELGAFATSPISTSSAAVTRAADTSTSATATRAADVVSINTLSPWYNENAGTLFADAETYIPSSAANQFPWIAQLDDGTSDNKAQIIARVLSGYTDSNYDVRVGGVSQATFDSNTNDGSQKKALAIKANDFAFAVGGTVKNTDSSGSVPTVSRLSLGNQLLTSTFLNGHIRRIKYYPRRLTNAELQAITT